MHPRDGCTFWEQVQHSSSHAVKIVSSDESSDSLWSLFLVALTSLNLTLSSAPVSVISLAHTRTHFSLALGVALLFVPWGAENLYLAILR